MFTNKHSGLPPWNEAAGGPAMTALAIENERRILRLRGEAEQHRASFRAARPMRARVGLLLVRLGQAVGGFEPQRQAAGHRAG